MKSDIVIIGGGASGLMAAYSAAKSASDAGKCITVTVLEKMPRPGRKIMITGKGRCNFTNVKQWNDFSGHIRSKSNFVKSAFYGFNPEKVREFFESFGMETVVERGDRAFPASYRSGDVVDTLVSACHSVGVRIETEFEVKSVGWQSLRSSGTKDIGKGPGGPQAAADQSGKSSLREQFSAGPSDESQPGGQFVVEATDGRRYVCEKLIVATGGLSYPATGSTGDGYRWAAETGHRIEQTFPSLTALVPRGYKLAESKDLHIDRETELSEAGQSLCGIQLENVGVQLMVEGNAAQSEFGDLYFTDGGIEGPIGFQLSRKAVKSMINGSRVALVLDLKPGVDLTELTARVKELWAAVDKDPRSRNLKEKEKCRILLGKLMPWDLIPGFRAMHPEIMTLERRGRNDSKLWINLPSIAKALKEWKFDIAGYVGYERAVVTAGGVSTDDVVGKTMESRLVPGLYFCGEVLDIDSDTGGYNLQTAFSTGYLAGASAASSVNSPK